MSSFDLKLDNSYPAYGIAGSTSGPYNFNFCYRFCLSCFHCSIPVQILCCHASTSGTSRNIQILNFTTCFFGRVLFDKLVGGIKTAGSAKRNGPFLWFPVLLLFLPVHSLRKILKVPRQMGVTLFCISLSASLWLSQPTTIKAVYFCLQLPPSPTKSLRY